MIEGVAKEETTEERIDNFIVEFYGKEKEFVKTMTLSSKMTLVNMKNEKKWEEFKMELRKKGYII
jgi:tRNA G10  N-methylase Trm11